MVPAPAEAGEQAQIDYGQLGRWLDPTGGRLRTVWALVMVLACSRHMFVRPVTEAPELGRDHDSAITVTTMNGGQ